MAIDADLRVALARSHDSADRPDAAAVNAALLRVRSRGERARVRRLGAVGAVVAAAVAVVTTLAVQLSAQDGPRSVPTPITREPSDEPTPVVPGALVGTWQTQVLTRADVRRALAAGGLARYTARVDDEWGVVGGQLRLRFTQDQVTAVVVHADHRRRIDVERAEVTADALVLRPFAGGGRSTTYRWHVVGGRLTLTLVRTDEDEADGAPGEVWQRALYTSSTFTRP